VTQRAKSELMRCILRILTVQPDAAVRRPSPGETRSLISTDRLDRPIQ
jgi:hypothetical protein